LLGVAAMVNSEQRAREALWCCRVAALCAVGVLVAELVTCVACCCGCGAVVKDGGKKGGHKARPYEDGGVGPACRVDARPEDYPDAWVEGVCEIRGASAPAELVRD